VQQTNLAITYNPHAHEVPGLHGNEATAGVNTTSSAGHPGYAPGEYTTQVNATGGKHAHANDSTAAPLIGPGQSFPGSQQSGAADPGKGLPTHLENAGSIGIPSGSQPAPAVGGPGKLCQHSTTGTSSVTGAPYGMSGIANSAHVPGGPESNSYSYSSQQFAKPLAPPVAHAGQSMGAAI
jgi:hypothetical protein